LAVQTIDPSISAVAVKIVANLVIESYLRLRFEIEKRHIDNIGISVLSTPDMVRGTENGFGVVEAIAVRPPTLTRHGRREAVFCCTA
jgi:hypothetical protein